MLVLLVAFCFNFNLFAQCSNCTITVNNNNNDLNISSGQVVCITVANFTRGINFNGGGTVCVSTGTTISSSINLNMNGSNIEIINNGTFNKVLNLNTGTTFTNNGSAVAQNLSGGTFINNVSGTISTSNWTLNSGTFTNAGTASFGAITPGSNLTINNSGTLNLNSTLTLNSGATLNLGGNINVYGNINTNSSASFNLVGNAVLNTTGNITGNGSIIGGSSSKVILSGTTQQQIGTLNIGTLEVNNAAGVLKNGPLTLESGLIMVEGILNANGGTIILSPTATTFTETSTSYVLGNLKNTAKYVGTGGISLLGVTINPGPDDLDTVLIERRDEYATFNGNQSIRHVWNIKPRYQPINGRTISLTWNSRADNGKDLESFNVFRKPEGATDWIKVNSNTINATSRSVTVTTNGFSEWTGSDENAPLPVEVISFTGFSNKHGNLLKWSTASELNNTGFQIERSLNGEQFVTLEFIKGMGTTNKLSEYAYTDSFFESAYYRFKQIDSDGNYNYSNSIYVVQNTYSSDGNAFLKVYPNPTSEFVNLKCNLIIEEITIYNKIGIQVKKFAGNTKQIALTGLPKGLYTIVGRSASGILKERVFLQ